MIKKKLTKLVGLKKEEFDAYIEAGEIILQPAKLIPTLKTGDEMALTSIFLSTVRLVKEYRSSVFKEIKLSNAGKAYYFTEVCFPNVDKSRIDGLIIVVVSGKIKDAVLFEMKNKNNGINAKQVETYLGVAKKLGISKLVTVSNEFVSDPTLSPVNVRPPKSISLFHFSWTYLLTKGHILMFDNDDNIEDIDQVEIMYEALEYLESPVSGVMGYVQMKSGWKQLAENIRAQKPLKVSDAYIEEAVSSWHEEEKDMALLLSRKLGVLVKATSRNKDSIKNDIKRVVKDNCLKGTLSVKNSVSDIKLIAEFERRNVSMSIKVIPPMDRGTAARITWLAKQLENCQKKNEAVFSKIENDIWIEADVKFARDNVKIKLSELGDLKDQTAGREIQAFHVVLLSGFGASFASNKKFIVNIENMVLDYYAGLVQYLSNWSRPAPKLR